MALTAIAWTGSVFVAVGDTGTILTSPTGTTWTARTSGVTTYLSAVTATDNYVVAMGSAGVLLFSTLSGVAWQRIAHTSDSGAFAASGVAWNGRVCVASGSQSGHGRISRSLARLPP